MSFMTDEVIGLYFWYKMVVVLDLIDSDLLAEIKHWQDSQYN